MRRMQSAFLSLALCLCCIVTITEPLYSQQKSMIAQSMDDKVHFWACNKGKVPVEVVTASLDSDLREVLQGRVPARYWSIIGQTLAPTGGCKEVYSDSGGLQQIFIGFGVKNSHGQFVSGRIPKVPDFGVYDFGLVAASIMHRSSIPIMQGASGKSVCVHADATHWESKNEAFPDSAGNCSAFKLTADRSGTGGFYPLTLALDFHPKPSECYDPPTGAPVGTGVFCVDGEYYMDVAADPATGDITVTEGRAPGQPVTSIDPAESKRNEQQADKILADAVASVRKAQDEAETRQTIAEHTRNRALVRELSQFSSAWATGQAAYVRGTVSRVEPSPDGRQKPAHVYFQDTPDFDVCILPQLISNPERYVGQRLEVRGRITRQQCGDRPAEMQVMLPTAIFELAKGEPPDEAILPGMDSELQRAREASAAREEHNKQVLAAAAAGNPNAQVGAQMIQRADEANRARWAGSHQSPAAYDPNWMGQNMVITGTVAKVDVDKSSFPQWLTIYFKESPDATFVICSPYPDMFQERVGLNLNVLVGKTIQVAGQVEGALCGHKVPKASIRALISTQWQIN